MHSSQGKRLQLDHWPRNTLVPGPSSPHSPPRRAPRTTGRGVFGDDTTDGRDRRECARCTRTFETMSTKNYTISCAYGRGAPNILVNSFTKNILLGFAPSPSVDRLWQTPTALPLARSSLGPRVLLAEYRTPCLTFIELVGRYLPFTQLCILSRHSPWPTTSSSTSKPASTGSS